MQRTWSWCSVVGKVVVNSPNWRLGPSLFDTQYTNIGKAELSCVPSPSTAVAWEQLLRNWNNGWGSEYELEDPEGRDKNGTHDDLLVSTAKKKKRVIDSGMISWTLNAPLNRFYTFLRIWRRGPTKVSGQQSKNWKDSRQVLDAEREPNSNPDIEIALVMLKGCGLHRGVHGIDWRGLRWWNPKRKGRKWQAKFDGPLMGVNLEWTLHHSRGYNRAQEAKKNSNLS